MGSQSLNCILGVLAISIFLTAGCASRGDGYSETEREKAESLLDEAATDKQNQAPEQNPSTVMPPGHDNVDGSNSVSAVPGYSADDYATPDAAAQEQDPAIPPSSVTQSSTKEPNPIGATPKQKTIKKSVHFKLPKKAKASVAMVDTGNGVNVQFAASAVKAGKYMLFMEKNCSKGKNKNFKPVKVAQFIVRNGKKFSGKAMSYSVNLKPGTAKSLPGKALVLYHGPRANTRVSCQSLK